MRNPLSLKIRTAIIAICTAFAVLGGGILVVTTASVSREITARESTAVLQALGKGVALQLARSLYGQWRETEGLVRFAEAAPAAAELRLRLETIAGLNERYAWIGLARPDGRVVTATGGILEGDSVAERPWFRAGIQAPFAGDVHEAVLLQRIIAPNATEPLRLIDFSAPVRRPDGSILGVIGSHVTWSAVRDVVRDSLRDTGRDVVLVSRSGEILVGPRELEGKALSLPSILAARQSAPQNNVETWPDGRVVTATGGILEGDSVAERPWFRAGIQAPFAGDVHEAVLLQRIIAPNATEPLRLIDFAAPVRRPDGSILGVIGSHVTWSAVRDVVRDSLRDTGRDVVLVSRSGEVLVGPRELEGKALSLPSILAARQSAPQNNVETWPDGQRYLTTVISPITYGNLPSFGWSLIIRQPADAAAAPARAITRRLAIGLVIAALIALLASLVVGGMVTKPLKLLRDSARALADDKLDRPIPDLRAYQETREIADALTRIQARLTSPSLRTDFKQAAE